MMGRHWEIATERSYEIHRKGQGTEELRECLEHLRNRGDSEAWWQFADDYTGWNVVNLNNLTPDYIREPA